LIELTIYSKHDQDFLLFQYDSGCELQDLLSLSGKKIGSFQVKNGNAICNILSEVKK